MKPLGCEPVFVISVAARLLEMHPQTLRKYEREGFIVPSRTSGNLRLYSDEDLERLRQVKHLVDEQGLNLAGVQLALELTRRLRGLQVWLDERSEAENDPAAAQMKTEVLRLLSLLGANDRAPER